MVSEIHSWPVFIGIDIPKFQSSWDAWIQGRGFTKVNREQFLKGNFFAVTKIRQFLVYLTELVSKIQMQKALMSCPVFLEFIDLNGKILLIILMIWFR